MNVSLMTRALLLTQVTPILGVIWWSNRVEVYRQNRAYANAVADSNYQMHVTLYNENDEIVQKCAPGSTLELVLCAQFPAWSNTAKYGRIAIYY